MDKIVIGHTIEFRISPCKTHVTVTIKEGQKELCSSIPMDTWKEIVRFVFKKSLEDDDGLYNLLHR